MTQTATENDTEARLTMDSPDPLARLLAYGEVTCSSNPDNWPDYPQTFGLSAEHIPALIHMALDDALNHLGPEDPALYAPVHACRALGQLKATDAAFPLLTLLDAEIDSDWVLEELPEVFALIGPASIAPLQGYLSDASKDEYARVCAVDAFKSIARRYPEERLPCLTALTAQLAQLEPDVPELNAFMVGAIRHEKYLEAVPLIEQAFGAGVVDETIYGTLDDVLVEMGAKEATPEYLADRERRAELQRLHFRQHFQAFMNEEQRLREEARLQQKRAKAVKTKRAQQKQARKQNRRK